MTTNGVSQDQTSSTREGSEASAPAVVAPSMWLKEPDPRWGFWWKGAAPAGLFALFACYMLAIVAYHAQTHVQSQVTAELTRQGLSWVTVEATGLDIALSGSPPSLSAARAAQRFAKDARCDTWLGALPCVSRVRESFTQPDGKQAAAQGTDTEAAKPTSARTSTNAIAPGADSGSELMVAQVGSNLAAGPSTSAPVEVVPSGAPRFYDLKLVVSPVTVRLEGSAPTEAAKLALQHITEAAVADQKRESSPHVVNQLSIDAGVPESAWDAATKLAIGMAARCSTGYVALHQAALTVDCETQTSLQRTNLIAAGAEIPPGITVAGFNVLALDEIEQCEEALVKLVSRSQIRFTTNSATLLPGSRPLLREIAHQLERCPGVVVVEGHTDAQGVREENLTLSLNRARAVVASLTGYGVSEARVRAEGYGPDKPLASNENATGRAQNRRIEFRVARSSEFATTTGGNSTSQSEAKKTQ